jgi:hypothetical protein
MSEPVSRLRGPRRTAATPPSLRLRAVLFVAAGLGAFLVAGSLVASAGSRPVAFGRGSFLLPVVDLSSRASQIWACPGPLPTGSGAERSFVDVVDPGTVPAKVSVVVSEAPGTSPSRPAVSSLGGTGSRELIVAPGEEEAVPLPSSGPKELAAVSVVTDGPPVSVSEVVTGGLVPLESPCDLGSSVVSYLAPGSTLDRSDVELAVEDPTATPAVVDVHAFVGDQQVSPPPLQGLSVPADGTTVVDISHFVVQQSLIGLSVTAVTGRVVAGALEEFLQSHLGSGDALVTGVGAPRSAWSLPPGPNAPGKVVTARVLDPGSRATTVTVSSPFVGSPTSEISERIAAGTAVEIPLPVAVPTSRGGSGGSSKPSKSSGSSGSAPPQEGQISIRASGGVGVVASVVTSLPVVHEYDDAVVSTPAAKPSTSWLLAGAVSTSSTADDVALSNPGARAAHVVVEELAGPGGASPVATVELPPGGSAVVALAATVVDDRAFALEVSASEPVSAGQLFSTSVQKSAAAGVPTTG